MDQQAYLVPHEVFISYAKEDVRHALQLAAMLRAEGIRAWIDIDELQPGENWELGIRKAIRTCRFILVLLSPRSVMKRGYVQKEIREALDIADTMPEEQVYIVPVRIEDCLVPDRLKRWQWSDLFDESAKVRLIQSLKRGLGIPTMPLLKEFEREVQSSLSSDCIMDWYLFHVLSQGRQILRSKTPSGKRYISDGVCLDIRTRNTPLIRVFDEVFPSAKKVEASYFARIIPVPSVYRNDGNVTRAIEIPDQHMERASVLVAHAGHKCGIANKYLAYIRLKYEKARIYIREPGDPVLVEEGDDLRFMCMPYCLGFQA